MDPQRDNRVKFLHLFVQKWGRKPCQGVSHNHLRDQEAYERWRRCQQSCRQWSKEYCRSWQLSRCPRHPRANMHVDLRLERRLNNKLSLNLKLSPVSLWKDHYSCLLSAQMRLECWQIRGNDLKSVPVGRLMPLGDDDESARTLSKNETSSISNVARFRCIQRRAVMPLIWFPYGYRLTKELRGQVSWQVESLDQ